MPCAHVSHSLAFSGDFIRYQCESCSAPIVSVRAANHPTYDSEPIHTSMSPDGLWTASIYNREFEKEFIFKSARDGEDEDDCVRMLIGIIESFE